MPRLRVKLLVDVPVLLHVGVFGLLFNMRSPVGSLLELYDCCKIKRHCGHPIHQPKDWDRAKHILLAFAATGLVGYSWELVGWSKRERVSAF